MFFAATIARMMYQLTYWVLAKGASLETLEQLMGSRTLGSMLMLHFELSSYNCLTIGLALLWTFSPLGGESFLRVLDKAPSPVDLSVAYYSSIPNSNDFLPLRYFDENADNSLFVSALESPEYIMKGPKDLWGNLKIPLPNFEAPIDRGGWLLVNTASPLDYTGFIVIPTLNITRGNTTFKFESEYLELECDELSETSQDQRDEDESAKRFTVRHLPDNLQSPILF